MPKNCLPAQCCCCGERQVRTIEELRPGKESLPGGRARVRLRTVCSSHWWSSSVAIEVTRRYRANCIKDHLVGLKSRGAWKISSLLLTKLGHDFMTCSGVSSASPHNLQLRSCEASIKLRCRFILQWPVINETILPKSSLLILPKFFDNLSLISGKKSLVCLQVVVFFHLLDQLE